MSSAVHTMGGSAPDAGGSATSGPSDGRDPSGSSLVALQIAPRLEHTSFSLYWKDVLHVDTQVLPTVPLTVSGAGQLGEQALQLTGTEVADAAAAQLGWPAEEQLVRLEGYEEPWSRVLLRGREVGRGMCLADAGVRAGDTLVVVRRALKADGWAIVQPDDFLSDHEDNV